MVTKRISIKNVIKPGIETINSLNEDIITKEHVTSLSKDNINSIHNNNLDNQDNLNYSKSYGKRRNLEKWYNKKIKRW